MKRTLNNTATAKKIAADCGLVFSYVRGARIWRLTSKDFAAVRRVYDAKEVPNVEVDAFYLDCQYVASQTVTPEQMNTVVERARYSAMQERLNCGEEFAPGSADALEFMRLFNAAYTHDRHVWEVENAIHRLLEELEEQHGTYSDHKAAHAAQVEEVETIIAQPVADLVAVASYANGAHVGLSVNGRFVLSFPARLVDGAIPNLQEAEWILTGAEVEAACYLFNVARACRVSLAKPEAPECVCVLAEVPQESNAIVMARAVAVVRMGRLTREYLAAKDGDVATLDAGISGNEQVRALAAEQARADTARRLAGVPLCDIDPMAGECCETCGAALESGQIGDCDECQDERLPFVAGWNMPGYMPDCEPAAFATFDEAKRYIIAQLKIAEEEAESEEEAETLATFAEDVNLESGPFGGTCNRVHYFVSEDA